MTIRPGDFGTAISCIDGRVQQPLSDWLKLYCHVRWVDLVTEPGPDKLLAEGPAETIEAVRQKVSFSVRMHHSEVVAVSGHHDCAGNPATTEEHLVQIRRSVEVVAGWDLPVRVVGLWVNEWGWVDLVCDHQPTIQA
jgi:hypothetical protein